MSGLRREEVAMLAGVSIDYYIRMERGNLAGASDAVLEGVARALQLDDAERDHLALTARFAGEALSTEQIGMVASRAASVHGLPWARTLTA